MNKLTIIMFAAAAGLLAGGCANLPSARTDQGSAADSLIGAWRGKVQFTGGTLAPVKDLEFMYVFNAGGTMTESSNYDGSPPVPPAYGVWRKTGPRQYEAKYSCFLTKAPLVFEDIAKGGGWLPGGSVILVEKITVAEDGKSFRSTIKLDGFDQAGKVTESGSEGGAVGVRMGF